MINEIRLLLNTGGKLKLENYKVVINANSQKSAQAIVDQILKEMPYLDGAITINEPAPIKPLSEIIEGGI